MTVSSQYVLLTSVLLYEQNQQRELTIRHAKETETEMQKRLNVQKAEYEEAIKRHISFIDQVIIGKDYR